MGIFGFRALTGFVKVVIYIAFGVVLIGFVDIVGSFVYTMYNADDLSHVTMTNTNELPEVTDQQRTQAWRSKTSDIDFKVHKVYGELAYLSMPRDLVLMIYFRLSVLWALFAIGVVQMAHVFEDVSRGRPFVRENAGRLRIVGAAMAGAAIFKVVAVIGTVFLFRDEIAVTGATIPWFWLMKDTLSLGLLFGGLIVVVISEVFRLGNALQEEHELTV